jgi:hypothetical protein
MKRKSSLVKSGDYLVVKNDIIMKNECDPLEQDESGHTVLHTCTPHLLHMSMYSILVFMHIIVCYMVL